jgi:UDP-N-acetylmuramoyl-L-alanyl-D-glutamate--2,6-diaminopimelate ligase
LKNGSLAVIDYAHTPDALEKALKTVKKITRNNLIVVFGCGGDRDRGKRPEMGKIARQIADVVFITDDNPRTENPRAIIDDILEGIEMNENVRIIYDRQEAITEAVKSAGQGDVILVAGKGHEQYQVIGTTKHDFDEVAIIREAEKNA